MGEPAGIGPEIVVRALDAAGDEMSVVVYGHLPTMEHAARQVGSGVTFTRVDSTRVDSTRDAAVATGAVPLVECSDARAPILQVDDLAAGAQARALEMATDAVLAGECSAIATAPVSKEQVARIWPGFSGHTEYLAERAGLRHDDVSMVFADERLVIGLVATHVPLKDVISTLKPASYERTCGHMLQLLRALEPDKTVRLAVAAVNPHAGEGGLIGDEEQTIIEPLCRQLERRFGLKLYGPIPADAVFRDALQGVYDGVVAAYHDQALIPLKIAGPGRTVNITMGLPFVRTSPDHGVAYDRASNWDADPSGMIAALRMAARLVDAGNTKE